MKENNADSRSKQYIQKLQFVWLHGNKSNTMSKMGSAQQDTSRNCNTTTRTTTQARLSSKKQGKVRAREAEGRVARAYLLVISGNAVHAALDENEAELGVLEKKQR